MARASQRPSPGRRRLRSPPLAAGQRFATPKSQRTYQRIIDTAIESFVAIGYARTSMSSIAERAGLTRSRVQYYFASTEHLLTDATQALLSRVWGRYLDRLYAPSANPDQAFDHLMALREDREHVAWMELVVASRTDAMLRRVVERAQRELDRQSVAAQTRLLSPRTAADAERLAILADLVRFVLESLTISVIADDRERRVDRALTAFKSMLAAYWVHGTGASLEQAS